MRNRELSMGGGTLVLHLRFAIVVFLVVFEASAWAVGGEIFYVRSKAECEFNGDGRGKGCALGNGQAGAWRGGPSIVFGVADEQVDGGDQVFFLGSWLGLEAADGGTLYEVTVKGSGSPASLIVFDFSGAKIDCKHEVERGISIGNQHHYVIRRPSISRCGMLAGYGISIDGVKADFNLSVLIEEPYIIDISGRREQSIGIRGKGSNITIRNPRIDGVSDDGIWVDGENAVTSCDSNDGKKCYIKNVGLGSDLTGDCVQYGASSSIARNGLVEKVYCDHRSAEEKQCFISNGLGILTIRDSVCLLPPFGGRILSNGIYSEGAIRAERNFIQGGRIGISMAMSADAAEKRSIVVANIIQNSGVRAVSVGAGTHSDAVTVVRNNTIQCGSFKGSTGIFLDGKNDSTLHVSNNSLIDCDVAFAGSGAHLSVDVAHNNDYRSGTRFRKVHDDGKNTSADPRVVGGLSRRFGEDYRLEPDSPIRRGGACADKEIDFIGKEFGCPRSVGAFAF